MPSSSSEHNDRKIERISLKPVDNKTVLGPDESDIVCASLFCQSLSQLEEL